MIIAEDKAEEFKRIGKIDFTVRMAPQSDEPRLQPQARVDALTAWLLAEWRREQQQQSEGNR